MYSFSKPGSFFEEGMSENFNRIREANRATEEKRRQWIRFCLVVFLSILIGYAWVSLFSNPIPDGNRDVLIALNGVLTGAYLTAVTFYFGGSEKQNKKE
jgi:uncharacterized membrane-anchored protein